MDVNHAASTKAIARAVGVELRQAREAHGWSRTQFTARLPSGIGERTLLSYEHGTRQLTLSRLLELCQALEVSAPALMNRALQVARIHVQNLVLQVDLRALLSDETAEFRPLFQWARNKLTQNPAGVVDIAPAGVQELADFLGSSSHGLAKYLAGFVPSESLCDEEVLAGRA